MHFEKRESEEDTFGKRFMESFESRGAGRDRQRELQFATPNRYR
jgi:hypothetical protein